MANIFIGIVIGAAIIGIVTWMVKNVKSGKSFCGAELSEPLNTTDNLSGKSKG